MNVVYDKGGEMLFIEANTDISISLSISERKVTIARYTYGAVTDSYIKAIVRVEKLLNDIFGPEGFDKGLNFTRKSALT